MSNRVKRHDNIISSEDRLKISKRYKRITKAINREFWKLDNDTANSFYVGSYGRGTAINTSDIDVLVILPNDVFDQFNELMSNGQSRLLQSVKSAIEDTYPNSDIRADGQIVKINFNDGILFEILPAFKNENGTYIYGDSNKGGKWKSTNPKAEQVAISDKNKLSNGLLISTCKHIRYIRDNFFKSYKLSGIVIDSFVFNGIGNWRFTDSGEKSCEPGTYEKVLLKYFETQLGGSLKTPGSEEYVDIEQSRDCLGKVLKHMAG